jgi:hypothetical protein
VHLFHGKSAIDGLFGCGCGGCFRMRLALENLASNARGPFPEVAADTLHERIFNLSMFYGHGPDAIVTAGRTTCTGPDVIYNSPATNMTAARTIASIAVIISSISFTVAAQICHGFPQSKT